MIDLMRIAQGQMVFIQLATVFFFQVSQLLIDAYKAFFYKKYYDEWTMKETYTNLITEKNYNRIINTLIDFDSMSNIKPKFIC